MTSTTDPFATIPAADGASCEVQKTPLRILALDCATRTGWATNAAGAESGVQQFDLRRGESSGMRYLRFRNWLREIMATTRPELVIYEQPIGRAHLGAAAAEVAYALSTRVQEEAEAARVDYRGVSPTVLKRFATGKGNAKKPEMMARASELFGRKITDDNEADALLLLAWAEAGMPESEPAKKARKKPALDGVELVRREVRE